eukprot:g4073.t1
MASSAAYELRSLEGRGQGLVASKDVRAEEVIFEECGQIPSFDMVCGRSFDQELSLVTVKTWMILSGVVVLRREKVEQKYQALPDAARRCYRSLHPLLLGAEPAEPAAEPAELRPEEHLKVWDSCGFDFCDLEDTQWNQVLHLMICPTLLSLACGALLLRLTGPLRDGCQGKGRPAKMVLCAKKQALGLAAGPVVGDARLGRQDLFLEQRAFHHGKGGKGSRRHRPRQTGGDDTGTGDAWRHRGRQHAVVTRP